MGVGGIGLLVMKKIVQSMVERNNYDPQNVDNMQRGSVLFKNEIDSIVLDQKDHYSTMRR